MQKEKKLGHQPRVFPLTAVCSCNCSVSRVLRFIGGEVAHYGFTFRSLFQRMNPPTNIHPPILHENADRGGKCGSGKDNTLMKFTDSGAEFYSNVTFLEIKDLAKKT